MRYLILLLAMTLNACLSDPLPAEMFASAADAEHPQTTPAASGAACSACDDGNDCNAGLQCDLKAGVCRAPGQKPLSCISECLAQPECIDSGWCTPTSQGICIADSDEDCAASTTCAKFGACSLLDTANGPTCGAASQADCDRSRRCEDSSNGCTFDPSSNGCLLNY